MTNGFRSSLAQDLDRFLAYKRSLGHPYRRAEFTLRSFDRYVHAHGQQDRSLAVGDLVRGWLAARAGRKPVSVATELGPVRQFFLFRRRSDPGGFVPGREWAPQSTQSVFVPHVLSRAEVRALLIDARKLRGPRLRSHTIHTLLLILYCTGLRFGEAPRLRVGDVDLAERVFVIRESKGKTRFVPFRADLARVLHGYRLVRDRVGAVTADAPFLIRPDGRPLSTQVASETVRALLRGIGVKPSKGRAGPRPYDLRHTFAVHRLTHWYRCRADIHARLPWLSAYLGHDDILGTEVYLRATPELLGAASQRFEARLRRAPGLP